MTDRRLVLVEWLDATGGERSGWKPISEMKRDRPHETKSVGWVAHEDDEILTIVPHISRDDDGDGELTIMKKWIQRIAELIEKPRRRK